MGGESIGLDISPIINAGDAISVTAVAETGDDTLALQVSIENESGKPCSEPELLNNAGDGRYEIELSGLMPGSYRITVESAVPQRPVDPVTDITVVWEGKPTNE